MLHHSNRYRLFILYSFVSSKQNSFSYVASLKLTGISVHIISTTALFAFFYGGKRRGEAPRESWAHVRRWVLKKQRLHVCHCLVFRLRTFISLAVILLLSVRLTKGINGRVALSVNDIFFSSRSWTACDYQRLQSQAVHAPAGRWSSCEIRVMLKL